MDQADHAGRFAEPVGQEAARFRTGHAVAIQQHELRAGWKDFREGHWRAASAVPAEEYFRASGDGDGGGLQRDKDAGRCGGLYALWAGTAATDASRSPRLVFCGGGIVHDAFGPGQVGYCLPAEENIEREVVRGIRARSFVE